MGSRSDIGFIGSCTLSFTTPWGAAIRREKQIKKWRRAWKLQLIEQSNPQWRDLYDDLLR